MNKKTFFLLFAAAVLLAAAFYCLWRQSVPEPETYGYVYPVRRDIARKSRIHGHIDSRNRICVYPQASGILSRISVSNGDFVRKGCELAVIDLSPQSDATEECLAEEQNARIRYEQAARDEKRAKELLGKGAVSEKEYENARNALEMAGKGLALASSRMSRNREVSVITAPIDGIVCDLLFVTGASVSVQTPICGIFDPSAMIFCGYADETDVYPLKEGMEMTVIPGANRKAEIPARLRYVSEKGEEVNGATRFEIRADILDNDVMHLRMGYSANAEMTVERRDGVLSIEEAFVFYDPEPFIWVLSSNPEDLKRQKWEKKYVTTGVSDGIYIEIEGTLPEETIVRGRKI